MQAISAKGSPSFLPGGKMILCSQGPLSIVPLDGGKAKPVPGITAKWAQYVSIGYILYTDDRSTLQALPFDVKRLEAKGPSFPLLEDVESFDISSTGTLLCRRGGPELRTVQWVDESGKTEPIIQKPGLYGFPQLSPDGKRLVLTIRTDKGRQIWIYDLDRRAMNRLILDDTGGVFPLWMPGGKYLLFHGGDGIFIVASDGSGKPRRILETDGYPQSISPDGRRLAVVRHTPGTARDVWMVPLSGLGDALQAGKPEPFINGAADELNPTFSPDGKWLAYASNQTGVYIVYVRSLKNPEATWQISSEEGYLPQWSPNGEEIIFRSLRGEGLWAASYSVRGDTFVPGVIQPFGGSVEIPTERAAPIFTISPSGNRIVAVLAASAAEGIRPHPNYILILNFFEEIKRHAAQAGAQ